MLLDKESGALLDEAAQKIRDQKEDLESLSERYLLRKEFAEQDAAKIRDLQAELERRNDATAPETAAPPANGKKGDGDLLRGNELVAYDTAKEYLGVSRRQVEKLVKREALRTSGLGQNKKITAASLCEYYPPNAGSLKKKRTETN